MIMVIREKQLTQLTATGLPYIYLKDAWTSHIKVDYSIQPKKKKRRNNRHIPSDPSTGVPSENLSEKKTMAEIDFGILPQEIGLGKNFPHGLQVMAVDPNLVFLQILTATLRKSSYTGLSNKLPPYHRWIAVLFLMVRNRANTDTTWIYLSSEFISDLWILTIDHSKARYPIGNP